MARHLSQNPRLDLLLSSVALAVAIGCGGSAGGTPDEPLGADETTRAALLAGESSLWADTATPAVAAASDTAAVELGVKFRSDAAGTINGIRFYKGATNTGTHTGHLWTSSGTLLGTLTFTGETASGWQTARFSSPISIAAGTTYVASYHTDVGRYAANNNFFATSGVNTPPLHALAAGVDGANGVYHYGTSAFPNSSYQSTNYWVDVVFGGSAAPPPAGTGLTGEYYDNIDFTNLKLTRTDPSVNFTWGSGSPASSIGVDSFSVRWTGQVLPQFSQTYTFYATSDDGVRLWVNGQQIINNFTDHGPTENSGTIALTAGQKVDLKLEYYENGGGATATLSWSSSSQAKQIIPQARLFPAPPTNPNPDPGAGDTFLPWAGGAAYYGKWSHGPSSAQTFFPIAVWLQSPPNANRYKTAGINMFVGLWDGPTDLQLSTLASSGIPTVCDQSGVWQSHLNDSTIRGWLQPDEPDNAQANSSGGYDPCIAPSTIQAGYNQMKSNDATRPVWLGLGRGVADTQWGGRGTCTGHTEMYPEYQKGADILSFDIYPVNEGVPLQMVAAGVDNLRGWSNYAKPVVADIEASNFDNTARPTPAQIKTEVWMALVHGAAGIQYFCHRFTPTFSETDCLDDAPTASVLPQINSQITSLANVLNTQSVGNGVTVSSSVSSIPVDTMLKRFGGATYLFAVAMRSGTTTATFALRGLPAAASAEVLGESRTLGVSNGILSDSFQSYGVHLYRITY